MGFADYLSGYPTEEAISPSEEDENFVINLIEEIKFFLLRKALTPNGAMSTTNHNINEKQAKNDVINQSGYIAQQTTLFALTRLRFSQIIFALN